MILSDRSIRQALAEGRIAIQPLDESCIQPSSVDLHIDRYFRVFRNHTLGYIDVKEDQEDLTELVEIDQDDVFILHPGEFVLGSTAERVQLPDDIVARLEGKSSLGRLGLLIHSSLPASEPVVIREGGQVRPVPIGDVVRKRMAGEVVGFDPETFEVGYHPITDWYEGPCDRIFEVVLGSGRRVRVTAGHNLFTLDPEGCLTKIRTGELRAGALVAIPRAIPDPSEPSTRLDVLAAVPEEAYPSLVLAGPSIATLFDEQAGAVGTALRVAGYRHVSYYRSRGRLPLHVAQLFTTVGADDSLSVRGSTRGLPVAVEVDAELAWMLGLYVAEGSRRSNQFTLSNTDQPILDRAEAILTRLGLPVYRSPNAITCCSSLASELLGWIGTGGKASTKRVPPIVFGWPRSLIESFLEGLVDGDGSRQEFRTSVWTCSEGLVSDLLLLASRLGARAGTSWRARNGGVLCQVYLSTREHKLLTSVPLTDRLLVQLREQSALRQDTASHLAGYRHASDLNNIERRTGRDAVRLATLRRLRALYATREPQPASLPLLDRLVDGGLLWDRVTEVRDTGTVEPTFDLEVRPNGRKIENFLAGYGGVFVSNTAGFVDAGWNGHLTLELSNVANLPITLYPGMKIGQISFLQMTTAADNPYGSATMGSKYQGQRGPTPSRYFENFRT